MDDGDAPLATLPAIVAVPIEPPDGGATDDAVDGADGDVLFPQPAAASPSRSDIITGTADLTNPLRMSFPPPCRVHCRRLV